MEIEASRMTMVRSHRAKALSAIEIRGFLLAATPARRHGGGVQDSKAAPCGVLDGAGFPGVAGGPHGGRRGALDGGAGLAETSQ